jgi:predicted RND superfamily exporter protein
VSFTGIFTLNNTRNFYQHIKTTHVREKSALTAESVGMGTFMTSLVLLITFVVFSFSDLLILMRFGIFASLGMVAGFWADMVLLPNLLIVFDRHHKT